VCSPFRNPLSTRERRIVQATGSRVSGAVFSFLARRAGVPAPSVRWRFLRRPTYANSLGELELDARSARVTLRRSPDQGEDVERLVVLHRTELATSEESATWEEEVSHAHT